MRSMQVFMRYDVRSSTWLHPQMSSQVQKRLQCHPPVKWRHRLPSGTSQNAAVWWSYERVRAEYANLHLQKGIHGWWKSVMRANHASASDTNHEEHPFIYRVDLQHISQLGVLQGPKPPFFGGVVPRSACPTSDHPSPKLIYAGLWKNRGGNPPYSECNGPANLMRDFYCLNTMEICLTGSIPLQ